MARRATASDFPQDVSVPHLFDPYTLKGVTLRNRIGLSPMCQYSSADGKPTDWHLMTLGKFAAGGFGLVIQEATAVSPDGRISPQDAGIWSDAHVAPYRRIVDFVKAQGATPGIQIAHAGRKASARRPWDGDDHIPDDAGGWPVVGPSAVAFGGNLPKVPRALTEAEIAGVTRQFVAAAERSLAAGFEWLELHFAHGYLASSFWSPLANKRTDQYGGSPENRGRFIVETTRAVRAVWPDKYPLTTRLTIDDYAPGGVTEAESVGLVKRLKAEGLDLLDASIGFNQPDVSGVPWGPGFLIDQAARIGKAAGIPVTTSWLITDPKQAERAVSEQGLDLVLIGRAALADPNWPYRAAKELKLDPPQQVLPPQAAHWLKR